MSRTEQDLVGTMAGDADAYYGIRKIFRSPADVCPAK